MKTKLIKHYGAAGEAAAYKWIMGRDIRRLDTAPEVIWRPERGRYMKYVRMTVGEPVRVQASGTDIYTYRDDQHMVSVAQAFALLDCHK